MTTIQVDIVSAESQLYSGAAERLVATGAIGELGIWPGHSPLITTLKPGYVRLVRQENEEEIFYVNGGILEVQPHLVTILADTAVRAADLDEAAAIEAKERAEHAMQHRESELDYAKAIKELAEATAQLQAVAKLRRKVKGEK